MTVPKETIEVMVSFFAGEKLSGSFGSSDLSPCSAHFFSSHLFEIYLRLRHKNRVCVLASAILECLVLLRREVLSAAVVKKRRSGHLQLPKMAVLQNVQKPHIFFFLVV